MKQDNKKIATDLIENFGGKDNITEVINCMTRVRVKVVDESKVNFKDCLLYTSPSPRDCS